MGIYALLDGRFKKLQSIQDQGMLAKMEILQKNKGMEADASILQGFVNWFVAPKLRKLVKWNVDKHKFLMIFGLEEDHVPASIFYYTMVVITKVNHNPNN